MEKMRGDGYKFLLKRFQLDTRGNSFSMGAISHWNNISQGSGGFPALDTFVILLDRVLSCLDCAFPKKYWDDP